MQIRYADSMTKRADTIAEVCKLLAADSHDEAAATLRRRYPFEPVAKSGRKYTEYQSVLVFLRDGFTDRYSGARLINPGVLRLLATLLPDEFPADPNWRMEVSHIAFWELFPTIDHIVPVARGGEDEESNWVTASMLRNSAKGNALLDEIDWSLQRPVPRGTWDGLTAWLIDYVGNSENAEALERLNPTNSRYIERWRRASIRALAAVSAVG
jgi:hypothetical protein